MKEKIETLYNNREQFSGYMLVWICKIHAWMRAQIRTDNLFWENALAHNSVIFIERAYFGMDRRKERKVKINDKVSL